MDLCNPLNAELSEVFAGLLHRCGRHRVSSLVQIRVWKYDSGYDGVVTNDDAVQKRDPFVQWALIGETVEAEAHPVLIVNYEAYSGPHAGVRVSSNP